MALKLVKKEIDNSNPIIDGLNDSQKKAVMLKDGPVLVVAGAGSGKTRVLTHRIAYLIDQGIKPWNILALTFTNKAAAEMKQRISNIVNPDLADKVWAGTFHSIFAKILRFEAPTIGYTSSFSIYDTDDSLKVVKKILTNDNISTQKYPPQTIRQRISSAKNQMISFSEYQANADNEIDKMTGLIYEKYESILKTSNAMDFDDLLLNMIVLFKKSEEVLDKYHEKFRYILVDEYQDTNRVQYLIIKKLSEKYRNICVVGDDAQSIYGWRGADIRNILDFQKDYSETEVIRLEQNYRSTKTILAAADSVIKYNRRQITKTLWTDNPAGDLIELLRSVDEKDEAATICSKIKKLTDQTEYTIKDFAVLYRTNAQSLALENAFRKHKLPYVIIGGISFYKRKEVKDTLAYLRLIFNPQDDEAFLRIVNEPPRGLGNVSLKRIAGYASENKLSLFDACQTVDKVEGLQERAKKATTNFVQFLSKFIDNETDLTGAEFAIKYIEDSGLLSMYEEMGTSDAQDRWNNIQQLLSDVSSYYRKEPEGNLDEYLQQITLLTDLDEKDTTAGQVKLMTLHSAKGLEFPVVFIAGLEAGLFPLTRADSMMDEEEEERRLFYVGITRAEQKLYLSYAERRMKFGTFNSQSPSPFIREIDEKYLDTNLIQRKPQTNYQSVNDDLFGGKKSKPKGSIKFSADSLSKKSAKDYGFNKGDLIKHSKFGQGTVLIITGAGSNAKAVVNFDSVGKKVLMLQYAKLEKV